MNNQLFLFFYNLSHYAVIRDAALFLSYPMKFVVPFCVIIWISVREQRKTFSFLLLGIASLATWLVVSAMKIYFMIQRPYITLNLKPLFMETTYSFPSNHAAFFTALALASFYINKKLGIFVSVCAFLIGISRIVIGVHTPLDVFAGFCVGIVVSFICVQLFKRYDPKKKFLRIYK
jgi:undecaprenyl-diphosphatase